MGLAICGSIDWSATGSMLSGWGTLIGVAAVIYAAHKGSDTFKQWRRQKSEERRIDLAEQVLTTAYKLKRAIEGIRSPMMLVGEIATVELNLRERGLINDSISDAAKSTLTTAQGTLMRIDHYKDLWNALLDITPVSKAVFGDQIEKQLEEFWHQRSKIVAAANAYARLPTDNYARTAEQQMQQHQRRDRLEQTLWYGSSENGLDAIGNAVNSAIRELETVLLPIIRSDTSFGTKS